MIGDPKECNQCGRPGNVVYSDYLGDAPYKCLVEVGQCR
jgi:hypothetical protein